MRKRFCVAAALLGAAISPAWAQAAKPTSAEAAAEAAAAMERAQRLAANPMRVILQAGKIRRKPTEAETTPDPADPASLRRTASTTSTAGATTAAAATAGAAAPGAVTRATPVEAQPAISTALVLQASQQLSTPAATAVPGLENTAAPVALPAAMPKMVVPQSLLTALPAAQPKLVSTVEPEIPKRLLQDTGYVNEVQADLSLRADGTVAEVQLIGPYPRSWRPYIVAAMEKWRFEPLASARVHRVQLVFSE